MSVVNWSRGFSNSESWLLVFKNRQATQASVCEVLSFHFVRFGLGFNYLCGRIVYVPGLSIPFRFERFLALLSLDSVSCGLVEATLNKYRSFLTFSRVRSSWASGSSKSFWISSSFDGSTKALLLYQRLTGHRVLNSDFFRAILWGLYTPVIRRSKGQKECNRLVQ